jgi:glycerol-3-phosphate O-acyltransferase
MYEPNVALQAVYSKFFDAIQVEEAWIHSVRSLASRGTVVYVLRNLNYVDFLALDHLTKRFGLPQIRFANDLGLSILNPDRRRTCGRRYRAAPRPRCS